MLVGSGVRVLAGSGVRVFVGGFELDDESPLVVAGVLVAAATTVGRAAVAAGTGVLVALGALAVGVRLGVLVGWRVAVGLGVAAPTVGVAGGSVGGGSVGRAVAASGSRSPIVLTKLISGWIADSAVATAVGSGLGTSAVGRGAAVSIAASIG